LFSSHSVGRFLYKGTSNSNNGVFFMSLPHALPYASACEVKGFVTIETIDYIEKPLLGSKFIKN
jgi:hypothetical protein